MGAQRTEPPNGNVYMLLRFTVDPFFLNSASLLAGQQNSKAVLLGALYPETGDVVISFGHSTFVTHTRSPTSNTTGKMKHIPSSDREKPMKLCIPDELLKQTLSQKCQESI